MMLMAAQKGQMTNPAESASKKPEISKEMVEKAFDLQMK